MTESAGRGGGVAATAAASVVVPCYTERRWTQLVEAVGSALHQTPRPSQVVVVVDHNDELLRRARRELSGVTVVANEFERGASGARNSGVLHTTAPLIALLDDDTRARPGWLANLLAPFTDPAVIGAGGGIAPVWERGRPFWFPDEFLWVVGASYAGMPTTRAPIRNVWSESMAVRRDVFLSVGGFRVGFGKLGERAQPEDTDLCLRMTAASGGHWMYVPDAVIDHLVPGGRSTIAFFLSRCWSEGAGKVAMARLNAGRESLGSESDYVRNLPRAVLAHLAAAVRGRGLAHLSQAGALVAGLGAAAAGGGYAMLRERRPRAAGTEIRPDMAPEVVE